MDAQEKIIYDLAGHFQKDCHKTVELIFSHPTNGKIDTQDATNVWMFKKLAELTVRIADLENNKINKPV